MFGSSILSKLLRLRWAVRGVLALGVAASIAANILHAEPNSISRTIAAWPPLALLLTVELVSRIPVHRRSLAAVRVIATSAIAGIAAWISYWHMQGVVARYGESGSSSYLLPFTVDGLIVVASVSLVELAGKIRALEEVKAAAVATVKPAPRVESEETQVVEMAERRSRPPRDGRSGPQLPQGSASKAGLGDGPLMRTPARPE